MTNIDGWTDAALGEYFRIKHGYAFKGDFFTDSGQYVLLTPGNFQAQGGLQDRGEREKYYRGDFPPEFLLRPGDMLVVMTDLTQNAPILGSPAIIQNPKRFLHNQRLGKIVGLDVSKMSKSFLYHLFNLPDVRAQIRGSATGSTVRHTAPDRIYAVRVRVPPLPLQERIASILSAYGDLIENNTQRIKILEDMAQMIYREWFVNFRFPGHENVQMVESELGPIPEGWSVEPLGTLTAIITKGTTPTTLGRQFQESGVNFVKIESISESGSIIITKLAKIDTDTHELLKRSQLRHNDILFSIAGAIGRVALVPIRVVPANTNQALAIIRCSDPNFITYLLSTVRSAQFQNFSLGRIVQTAQANVSLSVLKSAPILVPPPSVITAFKATIEPIMALVDVLSSKLENLRNTSVVLR